MCTALRERHSPLRVMRKPISACMSMPWCLARASMKGQSKKSPLYVTYTDGFTCNAQQPPLTPHRQLWRQ